MAKNMVKNKTVHFALKQTWCKLKRFGNLPNVKQKKVLNLKPALF